MTLFVTGGAGFIGSNYVHAQLARSDEAIVNLDALTEGGRREHLLAFEGDARHRFVHGDIRDRALVAALLAEHRPRAVLHFAAQTHVDRSIDNAQPFIGSNVDGTFELLEAVRGHWLSLHEPQRAAFRFLQVSTDEVYGSLGEGAAPFSEGRAYAPNNPYAASKAAADHLVHAWHVTYGLPVLITHCGNNLGPRQAPEKFIPRLIGCALAAAPLPLYGDGAQRRDWIDVRDHVSGLNAVLEHGRVGEHYHIGAVQERSNREVSAALCELLDALRLDPAGPYRRLVAHVSDRPGHDRRYAIDAAKLSRETGWRPQHMFDDALAHTVRWYLDHPQALRR